VLRDIKKWIRFYDQKTNRMDVARCLAEANIVGGDLLHIIATWPENSTDNRFKARIALACYEVLTPLTWPLERDLETMTVNHHRHLPVLQLAQLAYKRDIINYDGAQILHTAVRVALPALAVPIGDRTLRDQGIIRLVLYFIRNVAMVSIPAGVKYDDDESQISRSATIDAFSYQDTFLTLLTIASNMGEDFRTEDVIVMEIIFHLVKRVDISKLFLNEQQLNQAKDNELTALMKKEEAMLRSYNGRAPTRHNRFGTMVWVARGNGRMSAISGQDALIDKAVREKKMDNAKTFRPPRRSPREDMEPKDLGPPVSLNARANEQLRAFVDEFLDSGFNPLFQHLRKTIDREAPHLQHHHKAQFFYLVSWFLEAERVRQQSPKSTKTSRDAVSSFNLVAGVMNQEMFITMARTIDQSYNDKDWQQLTSVMRCFTQILLTVQDMTASGNEDDEEIAENILSRLFYEEATHDAVANIVRNYKDQGFEYLDACTDLTHVYLRILEAYAKQNVDMQVRSRRRSRKKKKATAAATANDDEEGPREQDEDSANDEAQAQRTSNERKFDFKRFANRFTPQGVIDTFVKFTRFYKDLNESQLKKAHRYFHRVAFKQEMSVMLFRVDIIHLLYNMIKGPDALDRSSPVFKDWEELVKQIIRKCVRKIEERPALITELLFSKINSTAHYLEYGFERQTITTQPKPGAELEFKHVLERDRQIAIAVGVLLDKNQQDHITWVKGRLDLAEQERRMYEAAYSVMVPLDWAARGEPDGVITKNFPVIRKYHAAYSGPVLTCPPALPADDDARRTAMLRNPHLRLLMRLVGFERLAPSVEETLESLWGVPSHLGADELKESLAFVNMAEFDPPVFDNDESAEQQLRRKSTVRKKAAFDDDGMDEDDDDEILFPAGGPTARKVVDEAAGNKTKRHRRRKKDGEEGEGPTEEDLDERARRRREKEMEKARKVKSEMYVHASDDETDDERDAEFFAREEAVRQRVRLAMLHDPVGDSPVKPAKETSILLDDSDAETSRSGPGSPSARAGRKRKSSPVADNSDGEDTTAAPRAAPRKRQRALFVDSSDEDDDGNDVFPSSLSGVPSGRADNGDGDGVSAAQGAALRKKKHTMFVDSSDEDEDGDGVSSSSQPSAPRGRADDTEDVMDTDDTPLSSSPRPMQDKSTEPAPGPASSRPDRPAVGDMEDDDDMPIPTTAKARARVRSGVLVDSSDDEE